MMKGAGVRFARAGSIVAPLFFAFLIFAGVGCGGGGASGGEAAPEEADGSGGSGEGGELIVFAAASLTDVFEELGEDFEEQNPGSEVRFNFASSSTIATQISQGAPADVFASADEPQMENVVNEDLVAGEPEIFARNREVVVVPAKNPAGIEKFGDLSEPGARLVLALDEVPAAEYAEEILDNAAEDPEYGPEFEQAVLDNVVSREEDVRASVNRVVIGDADATFGYASDVTPSVHDEVEIVEIPEDLQVAPTYPIAVLEGAQDPELARMWVDLTLSEEGQGVLEEWGFESGAR